MQEFREFVRLIEEREQGKTTNRAQAVGSRSQSRLQGLETERPVRGVITSNPSQVNVCLRERVCNGEGKQDGRIAVN